MTALCIASHADDEPREAVAGLRVCGWHADKVHAALSGAGSLAALWADVEDALTLKAAQRGAGGRSVPLPVDLDACDWRTVPAPADWRTPR